MGGSLNLPTEKNKPVRVKIEKRDRTVQARSWGRWGSLHSTESVRVCVCDSGGIYLYVFYIYIWLYSYT